MTAKRIQKLSVEAYINLEESGQTKYEFHNGEVFALAGGSINHALLCGNVFGELRNQLKSNAKDCVALNSEMKLNIEAFDSFVYPDAMVVCGEFKRGITYKESISNPVLIVEVLSKSTVEYDKGDKFFKYRSIIGFQEYVLIEQDKPVVEIYYRGKETDKWKIDRYEGLETTFQLQSIAIEIEMSALYDKVKFEKLDE